MADERPVNISFVAKSAGKMRVEIHVATQNTGEWDLATDEGPFHGGDSTAPPPLALFAASLAGCLSTQIRAFARKLRTDVQSVEITGVVRWVAMTEGREPYRSECRGIELKIELTGDHTVEEARKLVAAAQQGCFVERSVENATQIDHLLKVDGDWLPV